MMELVFLTVATIAFVAIALVANRDLPLRDHDADARPDSATPWQRRTNVWRRITSPENIDASMINHLACFIASCSGCPR